MGGKSQRDGTIFMGEGLPLKTSCEDFNWAVVGRLGWMK